MVSLFHKVAMKGRVKWLRVRTRVGREVVCRYVPCWFFVSSTLTPASNGAKVSKRHTNIPSIARERGKRVPRNDAGSGREGARVRGVHGEGSGAGGDLHYK